jgi:hypothetical protein
MANIAAEIIEDAKENYVPYKYGALYDSGRSDEYDPNKRLDITQIGMWFGGASDIGMGSSSRKVGHAKGSAEASVAGAQSGHIIDPSVYALEQHENLSFRHPVVGPVSNPQAKYLERPLLKATPTVIPRLKQAIFGSAYGPDFGADD